MQENMTKICCICGKAIEGHPEEAESQRGTVSYFHRSCMGRGQAGTGAAPACGETGGMELTLEEIDRRDARTTVEAVVEIGYYLKQIRDRELYREAGCADLYEYAQRHYGFGRSAVSRHISANDRFSEGGNSPVLQMKYAGYNKSQLLEMVSMSEGQIRQATPDKTVRQMRELKKLGEKPGPGKIPGQAAVATSQQEGDAGCPPGADIIDGDFREIGGSPQEGRYEELSGKTDLELAREELAKAHRCLSLLLEEFTEKDLRVRKQKLVVGALAGFICGLDQPETQEPAQPELPVMRNNSQRKEWLRGQ